MTAFNGPKLGDTVANNRFRLIADQSCNLNQYPVYSSSQHVFIAEDISAPRSQCVTMKMLEARSPAAVEASQELDILPTLDRNSIHKYILAPQETFWQSHENQDYFCLVYNEMLGPDLWFMSEYVGPEVYPASMVRKIARQALESLKFLNGNRTYHLGRYPRYLPISSKKINALRLETEQSDPHISPA